MNKRLVILAAVILMACNSMETRSSGTSTEGLEKPTFLLPDQVYGELFKQVQLRDVFPDNKTFVDCTPRRPATEIMDFYGKLKDIQDFDLKTFVLANFTEPPLFNSDFKSNPDLSPADHIKALWPVLIRSSDDVQKNTTLIALPNDYIVPGGRFREIYYWDTYFTMLGLHESGLHDMIENMLDNFAYLIDELGHIPNGNRTYYHTRSQPPFFSQMVAILAQTKGEEVYEKYADALRKEYAFWMRYDKKNPNDGHVVTIDKKKLNRYWDAGTTPRQESYKQDYELVQKHGGGEAKYKHLRSGAESGWDFSSRWFSDGENLHTIETTDIIPVDLNALLYGLEETLLKAEKNGKKIKEIKAQMKARMELLDQYSWNPNLGIYEDYNFVRKERMGVPSLATMYPLFFKMADQEKADKIADYVRANFLKPGGVVSTLNNTGQQWDAPNGWAPLQWMTIIGLHNYGHTELAVEIADRWTKLNEAVYQNTGKFVEKYNVIDMNLDAGGGEYDRQDGFGWSNGVYLASKAFIDDNTK